MSEPTTDPVLGGVKDFDADRQSADGTPVPFKMQGRLLHARPMPMAILLAMSDLMVAESDLAEIAAEAETTGADPGADAEEAFAEYARGLSALAKAIDEIVVERRPWRIVRRTIQRDDLFRLATFLIEATTNRPTDPPSSSEPLPDANGAESISSSPAAESTP